MKKSNEQKGSTRNRLINFLVKPIPEDKKVRSKSPVHKFQYQLPQSFFAAVDEARVDAGYDILPRFHHLSLSSSNHRQKLSSSSGRSTEKQRHHRSNQQKNSATPVDHVATKKKQSSEKNQKHSHHHRQKQLVQSSSDSPVVRKAAPKAIRRASK